MIAGTLPRKFAICVSLTTILGLAAFAGNAPAQATPGIFSPPPETISFPDQSPCTGLSGTTTNTVTDFFRFVNNADGTVHIEVYETQDYRSDWSDGTYLISHSVSHLEFEAQAVGVDQEFTFTQQDRGTLYSPDGQVIGYQTVFTQGHITWNNGTVITSPEQFRVTCT
jgi:hypothetical protein